MIATTTLLNRIGSELAQERGIHAMTDVTGFGVLGHALEMVCGSRLMIAIRAGGVPLSVAARLAQEGFVTGASHRNWTSYGGDVTLAPDTAEWKRHLLTDPQTSGGLLVACAPGRAAAVAGAIEAAGCPATWSIGRAVAGAAEVGSKR